MFEVFTSSFLKKIFLHIFQVRGKGILLHVNATLYTEGEVA